MSRKSDNKVKRDPVGVAKPNVSALLSMAAKLRVVAGRDLGDRSKDNKINENIHTHQPVYLMVKLMFGIGKTRNISKNICRLARQPVLQVQKLAKLVRVANSTSCKRQKHFCFLVLFLTVFHVLFCILINTYFMCVHSHL